MNYHISVWGEWINSIPRNNCKIIGRKSIYDLRNIESQKVVNIVVDLLF